MEVKISMKRDEKEGMPGEAEIEVSGLGDHVRGLVGAFFGAKAGPLPPPVEVREVKVLPVAILRCNNPKCNHPFRLESGAEPPPVCPDCHSKKGLRVVGWA